jgi:outer membrane biosynthesis protein TonB
MEKDKQRSTSSKKNIVLTPMSAAEGRALRLGKDRVVMGSIVSADVRVTGEGIAPIHAVIELNYDPKTGEHAPAIFDLASESGIYVNGAKVVTAQLKSGDKITIGRHHFTFELDSPEKAPAKTWIEDAEGQKLFVNPKEDFASLLLQDEKNVEQIFDYRPAQRPALEVVMSFFGTILNVEHFVSERNVTVGASRASDFPIPPILSSSKYAIVTRMGDSYVLNLDASMKGVMQRKGKLQTFDEIRGSTLSTGGQGYQIPIEKDEFAKVTIGDVDFYLSYTAAPPRLKPSRLFERDPLFNKIMGCSLAMTFLTVFALYSANVPQNLDAEQIPDRIATILYQPEKYEPKQVVIEKPQPKPQDTSKPVTMKEPEKKVPPKPVTKLDITPNPRNLHKPVPKELTGQKTAQKERPQGSKSSKTPKGSAHGQNQAKEGQGAKHSGAEGERGSKTSKNTRMPPQNAASRQSANGGKGAGGGQSQVNDSGNVDFLKGESNKIQDILAGSAEKLGKGGERLKGFGGFDTAGGGGLALQGGGKGGGGTANNAMGLSDKGTGGGRVGTGLGAAGNGSGIIGGQSRVVIRSGSPEEAIVMGSIDADAVEAALLAHRDEFRLCYEKEINAENPKLAGRVGTSFVIGSSGRVNQAGIESTSLKHPPTEKCILQVIKRIQFPTPRGGGVVQVTYPFKFTPVGG